MTRPFATLLVAQAGFGYSFSSFFLLPKFMATELHAGADAIGLVAAVNGVVATVALFGLGVLVDRLGRRPFLTAGALLMTVASLGFAAVDEVGPLIFVLRGLQAAAFAMAFAGGATLAVDLAPPGRLAQAIGLFGLTMLSMNAVAPAVVEAVADARGWPVAFGTAAGGSLACAVFSLAIHEKRRRPLEGEHVPGLLEVMRVTAQKRIAVVVVLVGATFATIFNFHQPFALQLGQGRLRDFFVAYATAAIVARLGLGQFVDRVGRRRVALGSLALYTCAALGTSRLDVTGLVPLGLSFGFAHGFFYPAFSALALEDVGENARGKVVSLFQGWFSVGGAMGAAGLGFLAAASGYPTIFWVAGAATAVAFFVLWCSPEGRSAG